MCFSLSGKPAENFQWGGKAFEAQLQFIGMISEVSKINNK